MTVGPQSYPGNSGTYIKDHAATGYLVTQFSRNVKDFPLNRYAQLREVKKDSGYFLQLDTEQAARLVGGNLNEYVWPDGADRPQRNNGTSAFNWVDYRTERFDFDFTLGDKAKEQAGWDIKETEAVNHAQQAMTGRTRRVHSMLANNANWLSTHRISVATIPGVAGVWDVSTTTRMDIKKSINFGFNRIRLFTNSVVKQKKDMVLVMNPVTAQRIGETQEMNNAFIQSREAYANFTGDPAKYSDYGLPNMLYGIELAIEDTVMVTSRRGAATVVRQDVMADGVVYLLSRPGALVAKANSGPSYSTVTIFEYEGMTVETLDDRKNRRLDGHVVDDTAEVMTAPVSGFKFESVLT